ncbi:2OG-Fe(II) oxygenase family protein [Rutstroemia sp. NJR-2017a WRK4]|nr:2OG-Fe(II) oxygenase family protein [Rutstroemia sp. NJR-2017a WRK4]
MPTAKYFKECPEFPSDVPIADIPTISYLKLQGGSAKESENLYEACREQGFLLLDLRDSEEGEKLLKDAETMFDISVDIFNLGPEALMDYKLNMPKDLNGYKPAGVLKTDDGKMDAMELYTLSRDEVLGDDSTRRDPEEFKSHREECKQFFLRAHEVLSQLMLHLDKHLGLEPGTLSSLSPLDKPSATSLRLLMARPQPVDDKIISLGGHTDIGTIAMLFHVVGGFQVLPAGAENINANWKYVRTVPGCALINIGDSLVEWTGDLLRSNLHRVVTPPGKQANCVRRSLAYLIRPDHNGSMRRLKSSVIPPVPEGTEEETRSVDEWAAWRAQEIIEGKVKPQTRGGNPVGMSKAVNVH